MSEQEHHEAIVDVVQKFAQERGARFVRLCRVTVPDPPCAFIFVRPGDDAELHVIGLYDIGPMPDCHTVWSWIFLSGGEEVGDYIADAGHAREVLGGFLSGGAPAEWIRTGAHLRLSEVLEQAQRPGRVFVDFVMGLLRGPVG